MSTALKADHVWVEVKSHRARSRLRSVVEAGPSYGVWPSGGGWPRGEFYMVPGEVAGRVEGIPGITVRTRAPRGEMFRRIP